MGCFSSKTRRHFPGYEDPVALASQTTFSVSEVEALFELFKSISSSLIDDGMISKIFDLFYVKRKGFIDFGDFVRALNVFHPNAMQEDKVNCKLNGFSNWSVLTVKSARDTYMEGC